MNAYASRSFMLSALFHGVILAVVLFFMMPVKQQPPLILPSVFVLLPEAASSSLPERAGPSLRPVVFTPPPVSEPVAAPSAEESVAPFEPAPPPVRAPVVRPSRTMIPAISERAQSTRTTIEQFRERHPEAMNVPPPFPHNPAKSPRINLGAILEPVGTGASVTSASNTTETVDADAYLSRLFAKLRAAHQKPSGLGAGLRVRVEFSLHADGSLADVRLIESSGNGGFDESVLAAFRKVSRFGVPPPGFGKTNRVTFRTDEEN